MNRIIHKHDWGYLLALFIAVILIFSPLIFSETHYKSGVVTSDFPMHLKFVERLESGSSRLPGFALAHSLWELLVMASNTFLGISLRTSAYLVTISSIILFAFVFYFWLVSSHQIHGFSRLWGVVAAIGLSLVTPLSLLALLDRKYYLGYISPTSFHNPTILLLEPFALLQFIFALRCFQNEDFKWWQASVAALATLLATFAKPSFAICLLPAMSLIAAYRWWKKQVVDWRLFVLGFMAPTAIILIWQFLVAYGAPGQSGIFFYPFGVMSALSDYLGIKFLLSILFPLLVMVLFFPEVIRDIRMNLAWLCFALGVFYSYFLAEGAPRTLDGNFIWSGKIALLVLFCVSTIFLIERIRTIRWKSILLEAVWILHVAFGIIYYYHIFITHKYI